MPGVRGRPSARRQAPRPTFADHDDGTVGFIAYDFRETSTFMGPTVRMASDRIYEVPEGATENISAVVTLPIVR